VGCPLSSFTVLSTKLFHYIKCRMGSGARCGWGTDGTKERPYEPPPDLMNGRGMVYKELIKNGG